MFYLDFYENRGLQCHTHGYTPVICVAIVAYLFVVQRDVGNLDTVHDENMTPDNKALRLLITSTVFDDYEAGTILPADDLFEMMDYFVDGYSQMTDEAERTRARMAVMADIVTKVQQHMCRDYPHAPAELVNRDVTQQWTQFPWDNECPIAIILDAQFPSPKPEGNFMPFGITDESLFFETLNNNGVAQMYQTEGSDPAIVAPRDDVVAWHTIVANN